MNLFNEILIPFNLQIFYFFNHTLHNNFFDFLMPLITNFADDFAVKLFSLVIVLIGCFYKNKKLILVGILAFASVCLCHDLTLYLKQLFLQNRPFISLNDVNLLVSKDVFAHDYNFSFPSGHTSNIFSFATAVGLNYSLKIREKTFKSAWILFPIAGFLGIVRIYIGVHFPFDVLIGALVGICSALIAVKIFKCIFKVFSVDFNTLND